MPLSDAAATYLAGLMGLFGVLTGALIAGAVTFLTAKWNHRQKEQELYLKALEFMGGGSQNRNLGIAAIERLLGANGSEKRRAESVPLLVGTAIYLLDASGQDGKAHELYNLERVMDLLVPMHLPSVSPDDQKHYKALARTVHRRRPEPVKSSDGKTSFGIRVQEQDLKSWMDRLTRLGFPPADV